MLILQQIRQSVGVKTFTDAISASNLSGTNTGDVTLLGQDYLSIAGQVITANPVDLSGTNATGILATTRFPALTGDVTTTSGSVATTISPNVVTYAKIQNLSATSRLLGSSSTTLPVQEITLGSGLSLSGTTLSASGFGGTVTDFSSGDLFPLFTTSVATSTSTPALSFSLSGANPYTVFGNTTGGIAAPSYFTPVLTSGLFQNQGTVNSVLHGNAAGNPSWSQIVNDDIDASAGIVDTKLATISTVGKVANSATTATEVNTPNTIVLRDALNNFSAGTITATLSGNAATATTASNLSGGSLGTIPYQSGAGATVMLSTGTSGQVLTSGGAGAPTWTSPTTGTVTSVGLSLPSFITVTNSPVTGTGTLTGTLASQAMNTVFAAPDGSAGVPAFRTLLSADIPVLDWSKITTGKPTTLAGYGITDAMNTSHAANGIASTDITNWNTAYGWGNHATAGYLTSFTETDPIWTAASGNYYTRTNMQTSGGSQLHFDNITNRPTTLAGYGITDAMNTSHAANGIASTDITNWNTAYGWGNHATAGYLTSFTETDPIWTAASGNYYTRTNMQTSGGSQLHFDNITNRPTTLAGYGITDAMNTSHAANGIASTDITNWNTAYGWGNHSTAGYLTSYTETDPIFGAHVASGITATNIANWTTAYGWGNHATAGYLTSFTETDPIWTAASGNYYTRTNMQTSGGSQLHFDNITNRPTTLAGYGITDAMNTSHAANGIASTDITNWNTAYGWGNHATAGYLTSFTETDPIWTAASGNYYTRTNMQTSGGSQLHFDNITNRPTTLAGYGITDAMNTSHAANGIASTDITNWNTAYGWGNHSTAGYLTSYTETDPIFGAHVASGITATNITNWNTAYGWGDHATEGYLTGNQSISFAPTAGDVTGSASGTTSLTPTFIITDKAVTLTKMADMASGSLIYRKTPLAGAPEVQTLATLKTDLGLIGTNSGDLTLTAIGAVPNVNGASLTGQALTLQPADATNGGVITTGVQTIAGAKTFSSLPTFSTLTPGSVPFASTGGLLDQDNANLFWDNTNKRLGIGTLAPTDPVTVVGDIKIGNATTGTIKATKELVLRQDGDDFGPSILTLRNRDDENGAIIETTDPTATLVDFIFKTANSQRNIRFEERGGGMAKAGSPSFHIGGALAGAADPDNPTLAIGDNYSAFSKPLRIGNYISPTALLHLAAGTAAAGTSPLKLTSGPLLTDSETGAIEFLNDNYYGTITTGAARRTFAFLESPVFTTPNIDVATGTSLQLSGLTATSPVKTDASRNLVSGTIDLASSNDIGTSVLLSANGGTGVNNGTNLITIGGNLTTTPGNDVTLTTTGATNVTLPANGTLYGTSAGSVTSAQLATTLTDETGTGVAVFSTTPLLTTPNVGDATGTSLSLTGSTSGTAVLTASPVAGTPTLLLPTTSGTLSLVPQVAQLTADVSNNTSTLTNVPGISNFSLAANSTYYFKFRCMVTTSGTGTGILLTLNTSGAISRINYIHQYPNSATGFNYERVTSLQGGTLPPGGPGATFAEYAIEGSITTSASVTLMLQQRSEVNGNNTVIRAGSIGYIQKIQ